MLPFVLKVADRPVERLQCVNAENEPIDVNVHIELYSRELNRVAGDGASQSRRLNELIYATFVQFLRDSAEPEIFLPFERLVQHSCRQYLLILSASSSHELFEICQMQAGSSSSVLNYGEYEITIKPRRHVLDTTAYLVAPDKYTLFMRKVQEDNTVQIYRSEFINLNRNSPPPFKFDTRDILENVQLELGRAREQNLPIEQLLMFPPNPEDTNRQHLIKCPECGGRVRRLGREANFCLECDWDNLPPLRQAR